jgi:hypothetical protein
MNLSFDSNSGCASGAIDYGERDTDRKNVPRPEVPERLCGMQLESFRRLGRNLDDIGMNGLTTFSMGYEESPPLGIRRDAMDVAISFFCAGVKPWDRASTAISHWKLEPGTGRLSADDHGYILKAILSRAKGFQPYYADQDEGDRIVVQEFINYTFGFSSPLDPEKFRVATPAREKRDTAATLEFKRCLGGNLSPEVETGKIGDRLAVVDWLTKQPGIESVRLNKKSVSVVTSQGTKINLRAFAFEARFRAIDIPKVREARARKEKTYYEREFEARFHARAIRQCKEAYPRDIVHGFGKSPLSIDELLDFFDMRKKGKMTVVPKLGDKAELMAISPIFWPEAFWPYKNQGSELHWKNRPLTLSTNQNGTRAPEISAAIRKLRDGEKLIEEEKSWFVRLNAGYRFSRVAAEGLWESDKSARCATENELGALNQSIRTALKETIIVAAERGTLAKLSISVFESLGVEDLELVLKNEMTLGHALIKQLDNSVLFKMPHLLTPAMAWQVANGAVPEPSAIPREARLALLSARSLGFRRSTTDPSVAQLLACQEMGAEWAMAMKPENVVTIYSEAILGKLESELLRLLSKEGSVQREYISVDGAKIQRWNGRIRAVGGLEVVLRLSDVPTAASLKIAIEAASALDELLNKAGTIAAAPLSRPFVDPSMPMTLIDERMVVLAAELGELAKLPKPILQNLRHQVLNTVLREGTTLAVAIEEQVGSSIFIETPRLLTPAIVWHLVNSGAFQIPIGLPPAVTAAILSLGTIDYRPSPKDRTVAQLLARGAVGVGWVKLMGAEMHRSLYSDETLENLEAGVTRLLHATPVLEGINIDGAAIVRGKEGIVAVGALGFVLALELTLEAKSLSSTIAAANKEMKKQIEGAKEVIFEKTPDLLRR